ncbi:hypothetical protein GCM10011297_30120 [Bacterioplanes sanyensis]|uniref:beta strand repeat-containing protein n=1 Tax=Bacterioplanes sanyensis TaxID=1249553 RepID=UPI0016745C17|nr:hypothetical protein [Bacterioplanes sanyensis]GGY55352.1 hypothetical protein GCM10011297_30120 [Bacterioplanes sanyensis]
MALSQFSLNEQHIIRAFLLQEGRLPTQAELNSAFEKTSASAGLENTGITIPTTQEQSNSQFALAMYAAVGVDNPDSQGLQFWSSQVQENRAEALINFQFAAKDSIDSTFADELADIDASLTPTNTEFADDTDGGTDPGTGTPDAVTTDYVFNTTAANPYDDGAAGEESDDPMSGREDLWIDTDGDGEPDALIDPDQVAQTQKESNSHYIFNLGKDAIDLNVPVTTADYTFKLYNQLGEDQVYEAYFLSPLFEPAGAVADGSRVTINVYDHFATANDEDLTLENSRTDVIAFRLNGERYAIVRDQNTADGQADGTTSVVVAELGTATTYDALLAAIQTGLSQLNLGVTAELSNTTGSTDQRDSNNQSTGEDVIYRPIVLTAATGELDNPLASGTTPGNQSGNGYNAFYGSAVIEGQGGVISTNIELMNAGYGSLGGSLNIAGQSGSDRGVDVFNIEVKKGNWNLGSALADISSSPLRDPGDELKVINVTGDAPYFTVANLDDVREFNASAFTGNVTLSDVDVTADVVARDLNLTDQGNNHTGDNLEVDYTFGSGNDTLNIEIDNALVEREDTSTDINMGNGTNVLSFLGEADAEAVDNGSVSQNLSAGTGRDVFTIRETSLVTAETNSGNDTIYFEVAGSGDVGQFEIGTGLAGGAGAEDDFYAPFAAFGATVTVSFAGFTATVALPTNAGFLSNQFYINQAVKEAIQSDRVLADLLTVADGENGRLNITSKVDGVNNMTITMFQPELIDAGTPTATQALVTSSQLAILEDTLGDSTLDLAGVDAALGGGAGAQTLDVLTTADSTGGASVATVENNSTVVMGGSDDLVVLNSDVDSAQTIVFSGTFTKQNIVNFSDDDSGLVGTIGDHVLDFTAYLTETTSPSGSTASSTRVATSLETGNTFTAFGGVDGDGNATDGSNVVSMVDFAAVSTAADALAFWTDGTNTFADMGGLSDSQLNQVLNAYFDTTNLDGATSDNVIMIEDAAGNAGEYLVITATTGATHTVAADGFENADLVGTIDFGVDVETAGFVLANLA